MDKFLKKEPKVKSVPVKPRKRKTRKKQWDKVKRN
jgi:hypothetical protein